MQTAIRRRFVVTGRVQGVGFRPFVFREAAARELTGTVRNGPEGVVIEVQGPTEAVEGFGHALRHDTPPLAAIVSVDEAAVAVVEGEEGFRILASEGGSGHNVLISPDTATCPDCLAELRDPSDRRYRYPFINCTNCGPRYTITRAIPYDRPVTSMACFPMCPACQAEYDNPLDRRFHAQPNACPECGPQVWLTDPAGATLAQGDEAVVAVARALAEGKVCAVKGLGGFHLAVDATNPDAVGLLRLRKHRPSKPLAVMVPDLATAELLAEVDAADLVTRELLEGITRPIVLLPRREDTAWLLAPNVAPDTTELGIMLPYTPLHHVLLASFAEQPDREGLPAALVMTSGNATSEPISLGNREALARLGQIADLFLFHNRDILIRTDDSVVRMLPDTEGCAGEPGSRRTQFLRRARGFTPEPVFLAPMDGGPTVMGTGPELKCTLCYTKGDQAFVSQHIGDMHNLETFRFYDEIAEHLRSVLRVTPELIVHDLHPDYMTTAWAAEQAAKDAIPARPLQHHYAHIHAVCAEHRLEDPVLGLALDGTGYGEDGTLWGGELLYVDPLELEHMRLAHMSHLRLPGGEAAIREPWRIAAAAVHALGLSPLDGPWPWLTDPLQPRGEAAGFVVRMLERELNCPLTSSCGRLFDAVAALTGVCLTIDYEAQAAIRLEQAQISEPDEWGYPCPLEIEDEPARLDTLTLLWHVVEDVQLGTPAGIIARRFHLGLVQGLAELAWTFAGALGMERVALSGGVMQNRTMATLLPAALAERGLVPCCHRVLPPGDACISLGQAAWGRRVCGH